jgi:hypothetical protein
MGPLGALQGVDSATSATENGHRRPVLDAIQAITPYGSPSTGAIQAIKFDRVEQNWPRGQLNYRWR